MAKLKPLELGQRVWIETSSMFFPIDNRCITEYEVVEVNKSSAYIVSVSNLEEYWSDVKKHSYFKTRVVQKNYAVKSNFAGYHSELWLSKIEFEENIAYHKELKEVRSEASKLINKLGLHDLKEIVNSYGNPHD